MTLPTLSKRIHTSTYRGVNLRHLSITQVEYEFEPGQWALADSHMDAMKRIDDALASIDIWAEG